MGTFHHDKGDLHGITVVVELRDARVMVGRCDTVTPEGVHLMDADLHDEREPGTDGRITTKAEYLARVSKFGFWKKMDRVLVPAAEVASVRPLAQAAPSAGRGPRPGQ